MSGGGAFFLLFVAFTILIGLPMLISEFIIGRGAGKEAISAYKKLVPNTLWVNIGRFGVIGCFLLLSFYCVVGRLGVSLYPFVYNWKGHRRRSQLSLNYLVQLPEVQSIPFWA